MTSHSALAALRASLTASLLIAITAQAQIIEREIPEDPIRIDSGLVRGKVLESGVKAYFGIPFAAPPVRELRWKPPQPVTPWKGVYNADRMMPECIQVLRAKNINHYFGEEATSEDCLYLNVWAPADARPDSKLPVIVYIYGGGNTIGSSGMALYGGEHVARRGAVFVNFNYRVGAMGFMAHPELTAESPHRASGNYAHLDQIAALEWIQRNIARIGGDPTKVIVTGQSAGGRSASLLQASPLAKSLFSGVVGMSGSAWGPGWEDYPTLAEAEKIGLEVAKALGVSSIEELRQVPADRILAVQHDCQLGCSGSIRIGGANIDGYFLPASPAQLFAEGKHNDVPVITGFTRDESSNDLRTATTLEEFRAAAQRLYGDKAEQLLRLYPAKSDADVAAAGAAAAREGGIFAQGARNWAIAQRRWGTKPVYLFVFSRVHPFNPNVTAADHPERIGAYHTSDVPFWLQTLDALNMFRPTRLWTDDDRRLARQMTDLLIAFANTGKPNAHGLEWPEWTPRKEQVFEIDESFRVQTLNTKRFDFHAQNRPAVAVSRPAGGARD
jgi:para-nitrobenzyl esterase